MSFRAYGFVDGGYLRKAAQSLKRHLPNPKSLVTNIVGQTSVQSWCSAPQAPGGVVLARVLYYDGRKDDDSEVPQEARDYWDAIELLPDTEVAFGALRGGSRSRPPRQKGVDGAIAVDMLTRAFSRTYEVAVLVTGDADFVPIVHEVKRLGVMVVLAAVEDDALSGELLRAADRFVPIGPRQGAVNLQDLHGTGPAANRTWDQW